MVFSLEFGGMIGHEKGPKSNKPRMKIRQRLLARNRIVRRRIASILPSYTYVGMFWASSGPLSHGAGFDSEVPTWLRTKIIRYGKKAWRLWPAGEFLDDLGDLVLGTKLIKTKEHSYLLVFGIRDRDDFTDFEAKVYRTGRKKVKGTLIKWRLRSKQNK
jgi:hypothetical protein